MDLAHLSFRHRVAHSLGRGLLLVPRTDQIPIFSLDGYPDAANDTTAQLRRLLRNVCDQLGVPMVRAPIHRRATKRYYCLGRPCLHLLRGPTQHLRRYGDGRE